MGIVLLGGFGIGILLAAALSGDQRAHAIGKAAPSRVVTVPQGPPPGFLAPDAYSSFVQEEQTLNGVAFAQVAVEPIGSGTPIVLGGDKAAPAWDSVSIPLIAAVLRSRRGVSGPSTQAAAQAVENADPGGLQTLVQDLGGPRAAARAVQVLLRQGGDAAQVAVRTSSDLQETEWTPSNSVRFLSTLAANCLLPATESTILLHMMRQVTPLQRWGLGSAGFGPQVAIADGWGPDGSGYVVRQIGVVGNGSSMVAVSMTAESEGSPGSPNAGESALSSLAGWLHNELASSVSPASGCG